MRKVRQVARSAGPSNQPSSQAPHFGYAVFVLIALVAAWLAYYPSLDGGFAFDDRHLPFADPRAAEMPARFWIGGVRPVLMLTYWFNFAIGGVKPFTYHALSILLHAATSGLAGLCAFRIFRRAEWDPDTARRFAWFAAGIFLLHPVQTESVAYIAGRSEVIAAIFMFGAFMLFLKWDRLGFRHLAVLLLLLGCGVLSKESAAALPLVFLFTDLWWNRGTWKSRLRPHAKLYAVFALGWLAAVAYVVGRIGNDPSVGAGGENGTRLNYLFTQFRVIWIYAGLWVLPVHQNADWGFPFARGALDAGSIFYGIALLAVLVAGWSWRRRAPVAIYGIGIFLLLLSPTSSILPILDALTERRMYAPALGLAILSAAILRAVFRRILKTASMQIAVFATLLLLAAAATWSRSAVWASDYSVWADSVHKNPFNSRARAGLASAYLERGRCREAVGEFNAARSLKPLAGRAALNRGYAMDCAGDHRGALADLRQIAPKIRTAEAFAFLGLLEGRSGESGNALDALDTALSLDGAYEPALLYRGLLFEAMNDKRAIEDLRRAVELKPGDGAAKAALARVETSK